MNKIVQGSNWSYVQLADESPHELICTLKNLFKIRKTHQTRPFPSLRPRALCSGVFLLTFNAHVLRSHDESACQVIYALLAMIGSFPKGPNMNSNDIRPGIAIKLDGRMYKVTEYAHVTPGNLRAFVQIKIQDIEKGTLLEKRLRSGENVEQVELDRRPMEYLYANGKNFVFMDSANYEQSEFDEKVVGDMALYAKPNTELVVLWCDGRPISIELPNVVELQVTDTAPGIKGATATNQLKEATCETGLKTRVPPFITIGEMIRINTTDGSYASRA